MYEISVERLMAAPIAQVWAVVADFSNLDWYQGVESVEQIGDGIGQIRRLRMPGMEHPVEEQLLVLDPAAYKLQYQVLDGPVNIMRDYHVTATLTSIGDGQTRALWQARFSGLAVAGVTPEAMIEVMASTYENMLEAIEVSAGSA